MKIKNYRSHSIQIHQIRLNTGIPHLKEGVLLLILELVGTEKLQTASGLLVSETVLVALKQLEDIVDNDRLEVNLLLIVEVLGLELDL